VRVRVLGMLVASLAVGTSLAEESPPDGFLEFLGSLVEQDGELIDPLLWEEVAAARAGVADPTAASPPDAAATTPAPDRDEEAQPQ